MDDGGQLTLGLRLHPEATFDGFHAGLNRVAVEHLEAAAAGEGEPYVYLWGPAGTGKTHLLQAVCHRAGGRDRTAAYLPLARDAGLAVAALEGLEALDLVCLDDVHAVAGRREWEEALFRLYNAIREAGGGLVVSARKPPADLALTFADLRSRLAWGLTFQLRPLDDEGKLAALRRRAALRGFDLPEETARYLLRRCSRDPRHLFALLDRFDEASLAARRRLTIPFVKEVMESFDGGRDE